MGIFDITKLKDIRKRLGLTQYQFAKQAGVSQSLIAKIEACNLDPSYSKVLRIEEVISRLTKQKEIEAKDFMTKSVISISIESSVKDAIECMKKHAISQLPVFDEGHLVGLISESSILNQEMSKIKCLKVKAVLEEAPPVVSEATKISVVAELLKQFQIILIRKKESIVGVITKANLLRALV